MFQSLDFLLWQVRGGVGVKVVRVVEVMVVSGEMVVMIVRGGLGVLMVRRGQVVAMAYTCATPVARTLAPPPPSSDTWSSGASPCWASP